MRRKLVQLGSSTLTVAVPPAWVQQHNLSKGDEVDVIVERDVLLVSAKRKEDRRSIHVELLEGKTFANRLIVVPYVKGYDEIICACPDARSMQRASEVVQRLIGVEVIDQRQNQLIVRNITSEREEEFQPMFRRTWFLFLSMLDDGIVALGNKDCDAVLRVSQTERLIEKYVLYCMRIINKKGFQPSDETHLAHMLLYAMENCSDRLAHLYQQRAKKPLTKAELEYLLLLSQAVRAYHDLYYDRSIKRISRLKEMFDDLYERAGKLTSARDALMWVTEQFYQLSHLTA